MAVTYTPIGLGYAWSSQLHRHDDHRDVGVLAFCSWASRFLKYGLLSAVRTISLYCDIKSGFRNDRDVCWHLANRLDLMALFKYGSLCTVSASFPDASS